MELGVIGLGRMGTNMARRRLLERLQDSIWAPKDADAIIAADGGWHNPRPKSHRSVMLVEPAMMRGTGKSR